ncbi:intraflagellar transport protein 172 [Marchantia polymorpha subsp. ruderalis]|uniref:IFT80/172/WDR35 TPR domain-containing protein n=2 Tax=Marchantia polymorpha TaxID=3197 RepID=A0AAF6ANL5_MARPO|nr:hypothetical protein MARPO_0014s0194 [Marchantia polymorpha]BBM98035.1 hypothetical protein Mp_1g10320 [Marchantia polymorpha subsp. ruderalis]|eukprot:PTQ45690.1 hypothetical protein MARPO_0014s0194 [Marchantia polymorpha]
MVFSPDSTRLAIAQSDEIIYVYKLGLEWGDKKTICNKLQQMVSITSILWPCVHQHEIWFGLTDGKVKVGQLRSNRTATAYAHGTGSAVVSLASSPDGSTCLAGHLDGSIYRLTTENGATSISAVKFANFGDIPTVLAWGKSVVAAGPDCKVIFYSTNGDILQKFDYSNDQNTHEFVLARFNPGGDTVVFGSYDGFHIFSESAQPGSWEGLGDIHVENLYSISAMEWKPDGSQFVIGGLCGNVDIYDACLRQYRYQGKFEFTYITRSQVIVRRLSTGNRTVLRSHHGEEITQINVYHDQYLIAHTPKTLLMGNLESCKLSEVPWCGSGNEKFLLDHPSVCMVHNAGELSLVEYGCNEFLGTCRTEHLSPYLISIRINETLSPDASSSQDETKRIAYLLDLQTIRILDLVRGVTAGTFIHDLKIDWLELNPTATHLLFRDKKQQLYLINILNQERTCLLNFCSYVQWVPGRDVVVAQNQGSLYVWYSIKDPEQATFFPIKGEVEGIERSDSRTEVIVNEGINIVSYVLDEALMEFGSALESLDYERAISILETLQLTSETEAMWKQLSDTAFQNRELSIAEQCSAALGDVAKARFIHKVNKTMQSIIPDTGIDGKDHYFVRSKLALLQHQWKVAEMLLLERGHVAETIQMYTECHRWKEAIAVAESHGHPNADSLRRSHFEWLLQTGQEEEAGRVKESQGDILGAVSLFLKGGLPGHAADCVNNHLNLPFQSEVIESIAAALLQGGMFEKAGDFLEKRGKDERAKEAYRRGHAYRRAIELARRAFPSEVVSLEEEWGSWLVSQNQVDAAINHFIEAGCGTKAIEAAIASCQWTKAVQIVEAQNSKVAQPFYKRLARHFESAKQYMEAEKFYIRANLGIEAVEMYIRANKWEAGYKVAARYLSEAEVCALCLQRARELEATGSYKDAEKLFLDAKEPDQAINMYKKAHMFDQMMRLVAKYRSDLQLETHLHLAQQLESEGALREAEHHYLGAQDWKSTVKMYSVNNMWEDAMRVAKLFGGVSGPKHVAYAWAVSLGGEAGAQLLVRLGLVEQAIEYATEAGAFEHAFDLCRSTLKYKLPEVQLKYAMFLEDEGRFKEAEEAFIKVGKPREAIDMYIHQLDWPAAMRVADLCDPAAMYDVQVAQAQELIVNKDYVKAEALLIRAKRPDLAVEMYKDKLLWDDAIRVAEKYVSSKVSEIHAEFSAYMQSKNGGTETVESVLARARAMERSQNYVEAINACLQVDQTLVTDIIELREVWDVAINLAKEFEPARTRDVVEVVAERLKSLKCFDDAGSLYEEIGAAKEAAEMYIIAGSWDKARKTANTANPQLQQEVENLYKNHLLEMGEADQLVKTGNFLEALELYVKQDRWGKAHDVASLLGTSTVKEFSVRHARHCLNQHKCCEAISILAQYGVPDNRVSYEFCIAAARKLFNSTEDSSILEKSFQTLRTILYQIVNISSHVSDVDCTPVLEEINKHLLVAHYITVGYTCKSQGLKEIEAKLKVSLLRYAGLLPADKVFYEAGIASKQLGWQNMAFMFLNRYLDITEAMDEADRPDTAIMDGAGFETSDIPEEFPLPRTHALEEHTTEEIRDWVIQLSMDQKVHPSLPMRTCEQCETEIYVASLSCFSCKAENEACCVTGYPVLEKNMFHCKNCQMLADRGDWFKFLSKCHKCPWCSHSQKADISPHRNTTQWYLTNNNLLFEE